MRLWWANFEIRQGRPDPCAAAAGRTGHALLRPISASYRSYDGRGKGSSGFADDEVVSIVHSSRHPISQGAPWWGAARASRQAEQ